MDLESFEALYQQHNKTVYRFALNLSGEPSLAEDITSETFVRAWTASGPIRNATVKSYLLTTARHLYVDEMRRTRRFVDVAADTATAHEQPADVRVEVKDDLERALASLQALPDADRAALIMRVFDDLSLRGHRGRAGNIGDGRQSESSPRTLASRAAVPEKRRMTMQVTHDVLVDLLPLYVSGEGSADTRRLVEEHITRDPALARLSDAMRAALNVPVVARSSATTDSQTKALERTRTQLRRRSWTLALAIFFTFLPFTFAWSGGQFTFLMFRDEPGSRLLWLSGAFLWFQYYRLNKKLRPSNL